MAECKSCKKDEKKASIQTKTAKDGSVKYLINTPASATVSCKVAGLRKKFK